jgi:probable H4MPT-linked C1 transfer pathway protein
MSNLLALDIGGANIKVADGCDYAKSWPFALWKTPELLAEKISECLAAAPSHGRIVVTMTGELCDCFETKREGVRHIVDATIKAAGGTPVLFYQTTGQFVTADEACEEHLLTAASNWHALATFAARYCDGKPGLLIDIGSTTTDIIPIVDGKEAAHGRTDPERIAYKELVYTGVERSPACAVVSHVSWQGIACPVAQEFFATSGDAYLLLNELAEDSTNTNTADGKPFTVAAAHNRLARLVCGDGEMVPRESTLLFAKAIQNQQLGMLQKSHANVAQSMAKRPRIYILSGQGEFLAREFYRKYVATLARAWTPGMETPPPSGDGNYPSVELSNPPISLNELLGPEISRCATAHALAVLASEIP